MVLNAIEALCLSSSRVSSVNLGTCWTISHPGQILSHISSIVMRLDFDTLTYFTLIIKICLIYSFRNFFSFLYLNNLFLCLYYFSRRFSTITYLAKTVIAAEAKEIFNGFILLRHSIMCFNIIFTSLRYLMSPTVYFFI